MAPSPNLHLRVRPVDGAPPRPSQTPRLSGALLVGVVGFVIGAAAGSSTIHPSPESSIPITVATFPHEVLGMVRDDLEFRDTGSRPILQRLDDEFEDQRAGHRFAHDGDGATQQYGGAYALTIVNGFLTVTIPTSGDPPAGVTPRLVSLRSANTSCVSEQPVREFHGRAKESETTSGVAAASGPASTPRTHRQSVWTDCVLIDKERNLSLRLAGPVPAHDIIRTSSQFRDELQKIHTSLIG